MQVIKDEGSRPIKAWVGLKEMSLNDAFNEGRHERYDPRVADGVVMCDVPDIELTALKQLKNLARLPFIASNGVAVMPDVHAGKGSTIGSVIATEKAIIPSAVGVDIGCGMNAVRLSLRADQLPDSLSAIRDAIEKAVPVGSASHSTLLTYRQEAFWMNKALAPIPPGVSKALGHVESISAKASSQLGTLGSGNHFIELCLDENDNVWIMLHSGSRGVGNMIGTYFIEKAKKRMEQYFITLPDGDLAYLPEDTDDFREYMEAVGWAQNYALENRREMMKAVLNAMSMTLSLPAFTVTSEAINCHHNYVERENHFGRNMWVTRKGAIRAREGDLGIIPGSMGKKSYIVRGKGNLESYCSCSHGAGRAMSRAEARRRFSLTDLINQTDGVECRKDEAILDEIPSAYKDMDAVMKNQEDLVEVVHTLHAVLCVKGA